MCVAFIDIEALCAQQVCVAVCCSVLQRVAGCCRVLQLHLSLLAERIPCVLHSYTLRLCVQFDEGG